MSPIPVSAAWVRGGVESNERDVEDAVPYGQLRNVTGSITPARQRSEACGKRRTHPGKRGYQQHLAHECNDVRGKRGARLGNVGLTDCDKQLHSVGQPSVLTRQRPRSETAVGDEGTKLKFRDDHL